MRRSVVFAVILAGMMLMAAMVTTARAQSVGPNARFAFTMEDVPVSLCNSYQYQLEMDGVVQPAPLAVTCTVNPTNANNSDVSAPIPPLTPATHTARVRAVDPSTTPPLQGDWSDPATFTLKAAPRKPVNLRLAPIPGA